MLMLTSWNANESGLPTGESVPSMPVVIDDYADHIHSPRSSTSAMARQGSRECRRHNTRLAVRRFSPRKAAFLGLLTSGSRAAERVLRGKTGGGKATNIQPSLVQPPDAYPVRAHLSPIEAKLHVQRRWNGQTIEAGELLALPRPPTTFPNTSCSTRRPQQARLARA
jgi:hypothetical protein